MTKGELYDRICKRHLIEIQAWEYIPDGVDVCHVSDGNIFLDVNTYKDAIDVLHKFRSHNKINYVRKSYYASYIRGVCLKYEFGNVDFGLIITVRDNPDQVIRFISDGRCRFVTNEVTKYVNDVVCDM